jgi:hypothetical protein
MDRADGSKNYFISGSETGISHVGLVSDARVASLVTAILDDGASSFILPDGFSKSSDSCLGGSGSVEFSAHGSAGLTVQNGTGLSTGIDASGTVDLGIPESTYEIIGDNYFITVPTGGDYHLITNSSSSDDLIVQAKGYDAGGSATQTETYVVSGAGSEGQGNDTGTTTAEMDFTNFNSGADLTVAKNGNTSSSVSGDNQTATTTFSVAPIVESSTHDITPPEITVSGIPDSAIQGSTTTILFSASDTDSGVALLYATLNGAPVANGDIATFTQEGKNIFRIEAIDNAGNPAVKEIDFTVSAPEISTPRSVSFSPVADTYIDSNASDANHGSDAILRLRARGKNRALVEFDEAAIKNAVGSSTIASATLIFSVAKNWENWLGIGGSLALRRMNLPWTESDATWNNVNASGVASFITEPSATMTVSNDTTNTISFDVTADIKLFLAGTENDGWILQKADECAPGVIDFGSRESKIPAVLKIMLQ